MLGGMFSSCLARLMALTASPSAALGARLNESVTTGTGLMVSARAAGTGLANG